jgi:hypothetical protein
MAKKLKINEQQLSLIINYIKEDEVNPKLQLNEATILNEGFKEWAIAGLMTLASFAGVKAQDVKDVTPDHIKAAELVQEKLKSGDEELAKYFRDADIQLNQENIDALKNANISDTNDLERRDVTNVKTAKSLMKQGFAIAEMDVIIDTVRKMPPATPVRVVDSIDINLADGNNLQSFSTELSQEKIKQLNDAINKIKALNGKVTKVKVLAGTDAERTPAYISNEDPTGNFTLAKKRAEEGVKALQNSGIDLSGVELEPIYKQYVNGGNSIVSAEDFKAAADNPTLLSQLQQQVSEHRFIDIIIEYEIMVDVGPDDEPRYITREFVTIGLIKKNDDIKYSGGRLTKGGDKPPIKNKCRVDIGKIKILDCPWK